MINLRFRGTSLVNVQLFCYNYVKCSYFAQILILLVCNAIGDNYLLAKYVCCSLGMHISILFHFFTGGTVAFDPSTSEILASATSLHSSLICLTLTFLFYVCVH